MDIEDQVQRLSALQIGFSVILLLVIGLLCYNIFRSTLCKKNKIGAKSSPRTVFFSSVSQSEFVVTDKCSEKEEEYFETEKGSFKFVSESSINDSEKIELAI